MRHIPCWNPHHTRCSSEERSPCWDPACTSSCCALGGSGRQSAAGGETPDLPGQGLVNTTPAGRCRCLGVPWSCGSGLIGAAAGGAVSGPLARRPPSRAPAGVVRGSRGQCGGGRAPQGTGGREPVPNGEKCQQGLCSLGIAQDTEQAALVLPGTPQGTPTPPSTRGCPGPHSEGTGTGVWGQGQPPVSPGAWAAAWAATLLPQHCAHPVPAATTWPLLASAAGGRYTFCIWLNEILPQVSPELWFHGGSGRPPPGAHRSGSPWEGLSKHRTLTYPNCSPAQKRI